jgi:hypothetical protein
MRNIITTHSLYYSESIIHVGYQDDDMTDKRKISDHVTLLDKTLLSLQDRRGSHK